jgi:nucleoside-diphosphate-sugar epimerase
MSAESENPEDIPLTQDKGIDPDASQDPLSAQGKEIEEVLQRAVRQALLTHKRAGNSIVVWREGKEVIIPPGEISVGETSNVEQPYPARFEQTVFLTGFPGFIAGRLVKRLASEGAQFLLHMQPAFAARAREDVARIAEETGRPISNFQIIEGDITQPDLGLSALDLEKARQETTTLFHLAAIYDLAVPRGVAMRVNVEGTRNVNNFARSLMKLRRYHYASTCFVAGRRTGVILETELRHTSGFRNYYEESKYLAEVEVDALKSELPITIHRPSIVCGDSRTGETAKYDGVYYLINYLRSSHDVLSLINIGDRGARLNIVPVDYVVEAMAALALDERAIGATVHIVDPDPHTTYDLFEILARALTGHGSRVSVPPPLVRAALSLPFSGIVTDLPRVGVSYFFTNQTYDTTHAQALLAPRGIRCPPFQSYAGVLVDFVARHPKLSEEQTGAVPSFTLGFA